MQPVHSPVVAVPLSRQANFSEIPVISLSALGRDDQAEAGTIEAIRRASEEVGFFYAKDHGVSDSLVRDVFTQCRRFFELPTEQREQLKLSNSTCFRGYLSVGERGANLDRPRDLLEALNLGPELGADDPFVREGKPLHGGNQWPAGLPGFRQALQAYYVDMEALGQRLLQGFALAMGMPRGALDAQYRKPLTQLRLLHYPAQQAMVVVFVLAWIGQFVGHRVEGAKPSFFKDLQFLLIGPLWLLAFIYRRLQLPVEARRMAHG